MPALLFHFLFKTPQKRQTAIPRSMSAPVRRYCNDAFNAIFARASIKHRQSSVKPEPTFDHSFCRSSHTDVISHDFRNLPWVQNVWLRTTLSAKNNKTNRTNIPLI